ncbi:MAG TPA: LPS export ABC transporter permease LptG [Burkholderiales bacterium]|nr:LPS export ABC transporter permease LptG [Burkholderiales bacterium]
MRTLKRYLSSEIINSTVFVFTALLMLFAFFDLVQELKDLGRGSYRLGHIIGYVLLSVPGHVYELFPIAALIGTLFALAQLVASSELTVMRVSGVSLRRMAWMLVQVGLLFTLISFVFGEFIAPASEQAAQRMRLKATRGLVAQDFRSGLWIKDETSFVNVTQPLPDNTLRGIRIYEFDREHRLRAISFAQQGSYEFGPKHWRLHDVVQTRFEDQHTTVSKIAEATWNSVLSPDILNVLLVAPEQRSARDLYFYVEHLRESRQKSGRFEVALWSKFINPLAVVVTMLLALPFSQFQRRTGGIGLKIFVGIMLGVGFWMLSQLFAHLGAINEWPPALSAGGPSLVFLALAASMLWWLERR